MYVDTLYKYMVFLPNTRRNMVKLSESSVPKASHGFATVFQRNDMLWMFERQSIFRIHPPRSVNDALRR